MKTASFLKTLNVTVAVIALTASSLLTPSEVFAATQGTLGATSTGSVNITVNKASQAQISSLTDMTLASYSIGGGNQTLFTTACVYSTSGSYTVKATGSGTASAYTLSDGASHTIPYAVVWNSGGAGALGTTGTSLTTNVTSGTLNNAATDSATCAVSGNTAQVNVNITGASLDAAPAGSFTGVLTLLVTPI